MTTLETEAGKRLVAGMMTDGCSPPCVSYAPVASDDQTPFATRIADIEVEAASRECKRLAAAVRDLNSDAAWWDDEPSVAAFRDQVLTLLADPE